MVSVNLIYDYDTYMSIYIYIMCSLTPLLTCGYMLFDMTPHESTLLHGPGYQNGGRSVWDTQMID